MNSGIAITAVTSLILGLIAGFVMYRSSFCMAGMFRDLFLFRSTFMLRILVLFVAVAMLLLESVRQAGLIGIFPYPGFGSPALTTIAGGLIFGVGMSLAGGCVAGTLYKMGSGSVVSTTAFIGLIVGSALYSEVQPFWSAIVVKTRFNTGLETVAKLVGKPQGLVVAITLILLATQILFWQRTGKLVRSSCTSGYLQPWKASVILAVLVTASVVIIGIPLGITTSYAKTGSWLQQIVAPEYVRTHEYFSIVAFDYTNRFLNMSYSGGPGPHADSISLIQFPLITGIVAGGFLASRMVGEFRIYSAVPRRQLVSALAGGVLMGLAARMAPSCNVWHLLGGLPILATQSLFFLAGLVPGAWCGGHLLTGLVLKETR